MDSTQDESARQISERPYHRFIQSVQDSWPQLELITQFAKHHEFRATLTPSMSLSCPILAAEIYSDTTKSSTFHTIDVYDQKQVDAHNALFNGSKTHASHSSTRILIVPDLSPAAIELLGRNFDLDPFIFLKHLCPGETWPLRAGARWPVHGKYNPGHRFGCVCSVSKPNNTVSLDHAYSIRMRAILHNANIHSLNEVSENHWNPIHYLLFKKDHPNAFIRRSLSIVPNSQSVDADKKHISAIYRTSSRVTIHEHVSKEGMVTSMLRQSRC
jgi:hypothetical protein